MGERDLTFAKVLKNVSHSERKRDGVGKGIYIYLIINIKLFPIVERVDHFRHFGFIRRELRPASTFS